MADASILPGWVQAAIPIAGILGPVVSFVMGKASRSGADKVRFDAVERDLNSMRQIVNDTVLAVSNHGQSIRVTDGKIAEFDALIRDMNKGIATLLERTKNL